VGLFLLATKQFDIMKNFRGSDMRKYAFILNLIFFTQLFTLGHCGDIPNPIISFTNEYTTIYRTSFDTVYRNLHIRVENYQDFPDELFAPSPHLPACGLNTSASRSYVFIFTDSGRRVGGFCAFESNQDLITIRTWGGALPEELIPPRLYLQIWDRETNTYYTSNIVENPVPVINLKIDWMYKSSFGFNRHSHKPSPCSVAAIQEAFRKKGIILNIVVADQGIDEDESLSGFENETLNLDGVDFDDPNNPPLTNSDHFRAIKERYASDLPSDWYWGLMAHDVSHDDEVLCVSGLAERPGKNFIVSMLHDADHFAISGTIMHELGHNLSLTHTGNSSGTNFKPNYLSVMNYRYQQTGIKNELRNSGLGSSGMSLLHELDYSIADAQPLFTGALVEADGIGFGPIDWNCDGQISSVPFEKSLVEPLEVECGQLPNRDVANWCETPTGFLGEWLYDNNDWQNVYDHFYQNNRRKTNVSNTDFCISKKPNTSSSAPDVCNLTSQDFILTNWSQSQNATFGSFITVKNIVSSVNSL
jgi:hypothetical protein